MSRFNLLDEPWISVIRIEDGLQTEVSVYELFKHAADYQCISGEMETQDFAVLRILLAVLQTVFSRYDEKGTPLVEVNEKMQQIEGIDDDEEELDSYAESAEDTWEEIWKAGSFPDILFEYLKTWHDHFFLLDEKYPFMQITEEAMKELLGQGKKSSQVSGRFINRIISESGNKIALFSPVTPGINKDQKDHMTAAEFARWLITFHGYTGLSDKAAISDKGQKNSKGWLFDIGGIWPEGKNLFETLMLNYIPAYYAKDPFDDSLICIQRPCWEYEGKEVADRLKKEIPVRNLAELYTNWSRAVYVDPETVLPGNVVINTAKLPEIDHDDQFTEVMSLMRRKDDKSPVRPQKHRPEKAMWRSFGLFAMKTSDNCIQPAIMERLNKIRSWYGDRPVIIHAVSMKDDGNATSWLPVDEITDRLALNEIILTDDSDDGWIIRINDAVNETSNVIEHIYRRFLNNIAEIRGLDDDHRMIFTSNETEKLYRKIDASFRKWIAKLRPEDSKETKISEWRNVLEKNVSESAEEILRSAGYRDYTGIEKDEKTINIFTAYRSFIYTLYEALKTKEGDIVGKR